MNKGDIVRIRAGVYLRFPDGYRDLPPGTTGRVAGVDVENGQVGVLFDGQSTKIPSWFNFEEVEMLDCDKA